MSEAAVPFQLKVGAEQLADLRVRLARTRWPDPETVDGWGQGVPIVRMQALCAYWQDGYDWRRCEAILNGLGQLSSALFRGGPIAKTTYLAGVEAFGENGLAELTFLVGGYSVIAFACNMFDVQVPENEPGAR